MLSISTNIYGLSGTLIGVLTSAAAVVGGRRVAISWLVAKIFVLRIGYYLRLWSVQ